MCKGPKITVGGSGVGAAIGGIAGGLLGGVPGAALGASLGGGLMGGGGGGGGNDAAYAQALRAQAAASVDAANISAQAARDVANTTLTGIREQTKAATDAARTTAMGGVIGAALAAHTTSETIKQWTPAETGAATVQSWELAQKWNTTQQMKLAGYQDVAINYELSGKSGQALYNNPQYNALLMAQKSKRDMLSSIQMFGVNGGSNPTGVSMSQDEWVRMHTIKDPEDLMKVDPKVAAERKAEMDKWERQMRDSGNGLLVDIYKNPQLGGSSILTMRGKEATIDPSMAGFLGQMMGGDAAAGGPNWDQVINALTQGEQNPHTAEVNRLMEMGVVDKYGMINAGALMSYIPPSLRDAPEFNMHREIDDKEKARLLDDYKKYSEIKVDPKLFKEESLGMGVTRKVKLNADGTIAGHILEGYMPDAMGGQNKMAISGIGLQDWYDTMSQNYGKGPMFPSMIAPPTTEMSNGTFEPGFWGANVLAKPNGGVKGFQPIPKGGYGTQPAAPAPAAPAAAPMPMPTPSDAGFSGAPLSAGE